MPRRVKSPLLGLAYVLRPSIGEQEIGVLRPWTIALSFDRSHQLLALHGDGVRSNMPWVRTNHPYDRGQHHLFSCLDQLSLLLLLETTAVTIRRLGLPLDLLFLDFFLLKLFKIISDS